MKALTDGQQFALDQAWDAVDQGLNDQFVDTSSEYGLSRWEKILSITPKGSETLDYRRFRIKARIDNDFPYTISLLNSKMDSMSNGLDFIVEIEKGTYLLNLTTYWDQAGQIDALKIVLDDMIPCNLVINSINKILSIPPAETKYIATGMTVCDKINLSDAGNIYASLNETKKLIGVVGQCDIVHLSDAVIMKPAISVEHKLATGIVYAEAINISD